MTRTSTKRPNGRPRKLRPPIDSAKAHDPSPEDVQQLQEQLLEQIAQGGKWCKEIEDQLRQHPAPELETIIKLHRVLVLRLSAEAKGIPGIFNVVSSLMKPVMDWARLEEKRKDRELAEQKYRDQSAERKANGRRGPSEALTPETLEKIEHELHLF